MGLCYNARMRNRLSSRTDSVDLLARLMATEDISVRHDINAPTASFDMKDRLLTLPVWEDMSSNLYDMLVGHEVAHALYTPAITTDEEFIADLRKVCSNLGIAKQYINVVEDARIERKIKTKFPGLRNDFRIGYGQMNERGFFSIEGTLVQDLPLIDRLNIHFKPGIHCGVEVPFSADEQQFVDRMSSTETWDEILTLAHDLVQWSVDMDESQKQAEQENGDSDMPEDGEGEGDSSSNASNDDDSEDSRDDADGDGDDESGEEDADADSGSESPASDRGDDDADASGDSPMPAKSQTQQQMEECLDDMRSRSDYDAPRYVSMPKINIENLIVTADEIDFLLTSHYREPTTDTYYYGTTREDAEQGMSEFFATAKQVANGMVKRFESMKNAQIQKRAKVARTGTLDTLRMMNYKFDDDIFRRMTVMPNGKNHGMVMLLDWSGSMANAISDCLKQVIVLSLFCRKANIPFDCYAFTSTRINRPEAEENDEYGYVKEESLINHIFPDFNGDKNFEDLDLHRFNLLHLTGSDLKGKAFDTSLHNCYCLCHFQPGQLSLGSTPLDPALLVLPELIKDKQRKHGIEIMNTIVITDGESTTTPLCNRTLVAANGSHYNNAVKSRSSRRQDTTAECLRYVHDATGSNMIGIYLAEARQFPWRFDTGTAKEDFKKVGWIENKESGYHTHFVIKTNTLDLSDPLANLDEDASAVKIKNAFVKGLAKRNKGFAYASRFIDNISSNLVCDVE